MKVAHEFIESVRGKKKAESTKVIVSSHNYQCTPSIEDLGNLVARIQASGADIVKIATTALDITDVARIFHITVHSQVSSISVPYLQHLVFKGTLKGTTRFTDCIRKSFESEGIGRITTSKKKTRETNPI